MLIEIFRCKINRFRFDFSVRTYCTPAPKVTRHKNKCKQVFRCEYDNERASLNHRKLLTLVGMRFCVLLVRNMQNCGLLTMLREQILTLYLNKSRNLHSSKYTGNDKLVILKIFQSRDLSNIRYVRAFKITYICSRSIKSQSQKSRTRFSSLHRSMLEKTTFANKIEQNRYPDITVAHPVSEKASRHGFSLSQREANTTRIF